MTTNAYAGDPGGLDLHFATTDKRGLKAFIPAAVMTDEAGQSISSTNPMPTSDTSYATRASLYYQVTATGSAQTLAALIGTSIPAWATAVRITPENGTLRYRCDGTAPTAAVGQPIYQQQAWTVAAAANLAAMQIILASGLGSAVNIEFLG